MQHELNVGREANSTLKEEYEILEERFRKATRMSEDQISELEKDLKKMAGKVKTLQDFYDKHDAILQDERNSSNAEIKQLRDEKDELTRKFTKELDEKTMALETLEGTQKVKMMQNIILFLRILICQEVSTYLSHLQVDYGFANPCNCLGSTLGR